MSDLLTRLKKLEGPCREMDALIGVVAGWVWHGDGEAHEHEMWAGHWCSPDNPLAKTFGLKGAGLCDCDRTEGVSVPKYTASLDAIVGLIERDLPEKVEPDFDPIKLCIAYVKAKEAARNASEDTQPVTATPPDLVTAIPALIALMNYTQMDEEGVMVMVSRQAIHEVNTAMRTALSAIGEKA